MNTPRFIPEKRTAIDGKQWWCVYDTQRHCWSTYTCHGKYKTRSACQLAIDCANQTHFNVQNVCNYGYAFTKKHDY